MEERSNKGSDANPGGGWQSRVGALVSQGFEVAQKGLEKGIEVQRHVGEKLKQTAVEALKAESDDGESQEFFTGSILCRYNVCDEDDESWNLFQFHVAQRVLEEDLHRYFPLPGDWHFRVRQKDPEFGHVYLDLSDRKQPVAVTSRGTLTLRALRLPQGSSSSLQAQLTPSRQNLAPPAGSPRASSSPLQASPRSSTTTTDLLSPGPSSSLGDLEDLARPPPTPAPAAEPLPSREELVARRLAEKERRIAESSRQHRERQQREEAGKVAKVAEQQRLQKVFDDWSHTPDGKWKDVRALLCSIPEVAWPDSGYSAPSIADLMVNEKATKVAYRKAILLCHPDKHQDAPAEQQYRADRIFNALNEAWKQMNN